jgi:hypothetical protein
MKPVQNKIFNAIQEVATQEDYDFVFDRSGDIMILFAKEQYDVTVCPEAKVTIGIFPEDDSINEYNQAANLSAKYRNSSTRFITLLGIEAQAGS